MTAPAIAAPSSAMLLTWGRHALDPTVASRPYETNPVKRSPGRADLSTTELVVACRHGDALAWRELVWRYRGLVFGIGRTFGLQAADAEDVLQQTFVELARSLPGLRNPERLEAWLVTTARRAALRTRSAERRRTRLFGGDLRDAENVADESQSVRVDELRMAERVRREIEALGAPCAAVLLGMFDVPTRSYRELAKLTGLAVGSLGPARARCLERLRLRLRRAIALDLSIPPASRPGTRTRPRRSS
jgi:RNA polymerase sigma factor (sigma-70 family)